MCCKKHSAQEASVKRLFALQLVFLPFLRRLIEHFIFQPLFERPHCLNVCGADKSVFVRANTENKLMPESRILASLC